MFNRGGGPITFDPLNRLDRQMNAHLFLFGPTGSGKSATLNNLLNQVTAIYRPHREMPEYREFRLGGLGHGDLRSEEHTSELQSLMRNSYAVFCLKKKKQKT